MGSWYMWCLAEMLISLSENRKLWNQNKSKHWNYISQAVIFLLFCQQANCKIYQVFCLANLFPSNLNANVSVILLLNTRSTALLKNNSVSTLYELTELSFHVIHLQDWRRLWLETKHSLKTFCGYIGKHVIRVGWSHVYHNEDKLLRAWFCLTTWQQAILRRHQDKESYWVHVMRLKFTPKITWMWKA